MRTNVTTASLLLLAITLMLAACGTDKKFDGDEGASTEKEFPSDKEKKEAIKEKVKKVDPICPQVAVIRSLDTLVDYGREKPNPKQLVVAGKLTGIEGECSYTDDGVDVNYTLSMLAKRGPALGSHHVSLPFFTAVIDPAGHVLNKNQTTADIDVSSDDKPAEHTEKLHVFIPMTKSLHPSGPAYQVLSGFQLSPEQVKQSDK